MARVSQRVPKASISFYSVFHLFSLTTLFSLSILVRFKHVSGDARYLGYFLLSTLLLFFVFIFTIIHDMYISFIFHTYFFPLASLYILLRLCQASSEEYERQD